MAKEFFDFGKICGREEASLGMDGYNDISSIPLHHFVDEPQSEFAIRGTPVGKTLLYLRGRAVGIPDELASQQARKDHSSQPSASELYQRLKEARSAEQRGHVAAFESGYSLGYMEVKPEGDRRIAAAREQHRRRLEHHRQLTQELLDRVPDDELEQAISDYVAGKIGDQWHHRYEIVSGLPKGIRLVFAVRTMEGEVNGDGFQHLLECSAWEFATMAVEGFRLVGAHRHATLMERAIRIMEQERQYPTPVDPDKDHPVFGVLDREFYALDDEEPVHPLIAAHVRSHPEQFVAD